MESDNIKRMFTLYYDNAKLCAEEVLKRLKDHEDQESLLAELRKAVEKVYGFEKQAREESAALDEIELELSQNEGAIPSEDISELLERKLSQRKTSKSYVTAVKDFDDHVKKVRDDLELNDMIVEESDNQIDPYSKKPIENPVRSRFCNHAFEKTVIMQIIAQKEKERGKMAQIRCPYMGCNKRFTGKDLIGVNDEDSN